MQGGYGASGAPRMLPAGQSFNIDLGGININGSSNDLTEQQVKQIVGSGMQQIQQDLERATKQQQNAAQFRDSMARSFMM